MNVIRKGDYVCVVFSDGQEYHSEECTDDLWFDIMVNYHDEDALKELLIEECPECTGPLVEAKLPYSNILTKKGNSVYMLDVSELSIPEDFALKILEAEEANDEKEITKYKNFWTLVSLNPDSRVRDNIFWFIRTWDMKIADSGLIIAYRNADIKSESFFTTEETKEIINSYYSHKYIDGTNPELVSHICSSGKEVNLGEAYNKIVNGDDSPVYTDHHSHSTTIILGKPVKLPREKCDCVQDNVCSSGLHVASKGWLKSNYFGSVGLQVLVNPANVVAVPPRDSYGKMRCCEYFPVALIDFDSNGDIIEAPYDRHNDIAYLNQIVYDGTINNEDVNHYELSCSYNSNEEMYDKILSRLKETNR